MTEPAHLANRYRLEGEIGRGTMGTVFRAYDEVLRRAVAIKQIVLPSGMHSDEAEQISRRALREAQAVAALSHPHVITLYDILTLDSGPAIVMELMMARTLADIVDTDGALPDTAAATVGAAVADGLVAAHAAGITHRDVKPANVLIGDDDRIKLTDFGIARTASEQTLTATGILLGSPAYISPEVAAGHPAGPAADAWGLGALLYAACEGHPPYDKGTPIATLTAVVSDPVPPHPHAGRLHPVIEGLLVKEPADRMSLPRALELLRAVADASVSFQVRSDRHTASALPANTPGELDNARQPHAEQPHARQPHAEQPNARVPESTPETDPTRPAPSLSPPPPWARDNAPPLPPLPAKAPKPARGAVLALAVACGLVAAGVAFACVLVIATLA